jgi:hypothetical protein
MTSLTKEWGQLETNAGYSGKMLRSVFMYYPSPYAVLVQMSTAKQKKLMGLDAAHQPEALSLQTLSRARDSPPSTVTSQRSFQDTCGTSTPQPRSPYVQEHRDAIYALPPVDTGYAWIYLTAAFFVGE